MVYLDVPTLTAMTGYGIMLQYQNSSGMSWMEPVSGLYNGLAFLYFGISIVTIVVMTVLFQNIKAGQEEKLQNELLAAQIDSMERHIGQVESLYQNIRSIRHDMANHILTLERLYAGNNAGGSGELQQGIEDRHFCDCRGDKKRKSRNGCDSSGSKK